jgi:hypothetical protein
MVLTGAAFHHKYYSYLYSYTMPKEIRSVSYHAFLFLFLVYFFGGLECVGHSFAYVAYVVFLRDVWIRIQRTAVASRRATNLATHLSDLATHHAFLLVI